MPIDEKLPFVPVSIAVLTVSDTRDLEQDTIRTRHWRIGVVEAGHPLVDRAIVRDEVEEIRGRCRPGSPIGGRMCVITTGGTGFTGRDVTPEAVEPTLREAPMDGFSAVFHRISYDKIGTSTLHRRATAGVCEVATYVFVTSGSPGACKDAWDGSLRFQARTTATSPGQFSARIMAPPR